MSPRVGVMHRVCLCFPRVSGDEPGQAASAVTLNVFSPRERG